MSPFKWKLSACTYTWCYWFVEILENEIWKFARNLPLATFGSERVKNENGDGNDDKEFSFIVDAPYDFKFPHAKFYIIDNSEIISLSVAFSFETPP